MHKATNGMSKEAIAARRAYNNKWRQEHPDKVREYKRRFLEKQAREQSTQTKDR